MPHAARWGDEMSGSEDRYERRLVEETGKLRVEMAGVETRLVDRIGTAEGVLRQEMSSMELRLVREMSALRGEMGTHKADLLKWTCALWATQMAALAAVLVALWK